MCGRAQWPWRVLRTAGVAGVHVYFWARVRWVFGSSAVARILCAGSVGLLLRRRILVEVRTLLCDAYSGCGWAPPYLCVWSGHLAAGRFLCTALGPVAVSVFCVCLGSLWGVFCVRPGAQWRGLFLVQLGAVAGVFCVLSGLRACCGARVRWVSGACWVAHLLRAGRGLFPGTAGVAGVRVYFWARVRWVLGSSGVGVFCARLRVFLFVMRWIVPLCLILTAFFPPFPGACRNLARKPLFFGYNAYAVGLMFGVRGP